MRCSTCQRENPAEARFCLQCGAPFSARCASCGRELPGDARFCLHCGQPVSAGSTPGSSSEPAAAPVSAPSAPSRPIAPAAPAGPMPTSVGGGRYQIRSFLGEGTKKRVYLAHDSRLRSDVAVALIKSEGLDAEGRVRVQREAQAMGRLRDHPHIVPVFDIGEENGQPFIVSQYLEGGALADRLSAAELHRLSVDEAITVAEQVCSALEHAHQNGIVHRDLKPGNIWLGPDGTAKLGDFGLAVALDRSRLTQEGMLVGTVAYMAPEQAMGRVADARGDLYALGATLYEMVTGRPPFLGDDAVAVISQHINTPPVAPGWHNAEVPQALEDLILRLLEKDLSTRPASAGMVAEELRGVRQRAREQPPRRRRRPHRRAADSPASSGAARRWTS
jgi:serine/threonine protein kinase